MIEVHLKRRGKVLSTTPFESLTKALEYARNQDIGIEFTIREDNKLLAKGKIEDLKEFNYEV